MPEDAQELNLPLLAWKFILLYSGICFYFHLWQSLGSCINHEKPDSEKHHPHQHPACSSQVWSCLIALCTQEQGYWASNGGIHTWKGPWESGRAFSTPVFLVGCVGAGTELVTASDATLQCPHLRAHSTLPVRPWKHILQSPKPAWGAQS